jgi:hypothetical protein
MTIQNTTGTVESTAASEISSASFDAYSASEAALPSLDAILRSSPVLRGAAERAEALPAEEEEEQSDTTQDETSEDPDADDSSEETADEEDDEQADEEEEQSDDEQSTAEPAHFAEEQIDWAATVPVKIDGKVVKVSLADLRKGYATDQHLSQKGREIGDLKKAAETERETKLAEVIQLADVLNTELSAGENAIAAQFAEVKKQRDDAKKNGDVYATREANERMRELQEEYAAAQQTRKEKLTKVAGAYQKRVQDEKQALGAKFAKEAPELIKGYTDEVAAKCRDFALKEGVPEALLESIYDARVVKFINDYRSLKEAVEKGASKRTEKKVPASKAVPMKKGTPPSVAAKKAKANLRSTVLSGKGDTSQQLDFLKGISSISRKLK